MSFIGKVVPREVVSYVGKVVQVLEKVSAAHPTENRWLCEGDMIRVDYETNLQIGFNRPGHVSMFGPDTQSVMKDRVRLVDNNLLKSSKECTCPDLLHGHHFGCLYYKS